MDNGISKEQRDYYKEKKRLELQTNLENNISELQKEIQQLDQVFRSKNIEDKIIGLQTSINPKLIKEFFEQHSKRKKQSFKYKIGFTILLLIGSIFYNIYFIEQNGMGFYSLMLYSVSLFVVGSMFFSIIGSSKSELYKRRFGEFSFHEVQNFIKKNQLSEDEYLLKITLEDIKRSLSESDQTREQIDERIVERNIKEINNLENFFYIIPTFSFCHFL